MTVEYLKKAETDLVALGTPIRTPDWGAAGEYPVLVEVKDATGGVVFRARVTMWVTPKKG